MKEIFIKYKKYFFFALLGLVFAGIVYFIIWGIVEVFQTAKTFQSPANRNLTTEQNQNPEIQKRNFSFSENINISDLKEVDFFIFYNFNCPLCKSAFSEIHRIMELSAENQKKYFHVPQGKSDELISKGAICAANYEKLTEFLRYNYMNNSGLTGNPLEDKRRMLKERFSGFKGLFRKKINQNMPDNQNSKDSSSRTTNEINMAMKNLMSFADRARINRQEFLSCIQSIEAENIFLERKRLMKEKNIHQLPALYQNNSVFSGRQALEKLKNEF
ncbi:MAG: hypothetical protein OEZ13_06030 [Spirochaetia bacterium]|nr:hypothetical protein [Spirochaetia bacterium]